MLSLSACGYIIVIFIGWFRACQVLLYAVIVSLWLYYCYIYRLVQGLSGAAVCCHCQSVVILLLYLQAGSEPVRCCCVLSLSACDYITVIFTGWFRACQVLLCAAIVSLWLYYCYSYRLVQGLSGAAVFCQCQPVVILLLYLQAGSEPVRGCCVMKLSACSYIIARPIFTGWFRAFRSCCVMPLLACGYIIAIFTGWFRAFRSCCVLSISPCGCYMLLLYLQAFSGPVRYCCVLSLSACDCITVIFTGWFRACQVLLFAVIVSL